MFTDPTTLTFTDPAIEAIFSDSSTLASTAGLFFTLLGLFGMLHKHNLSFYI